MDKLEKRLDQAKKKNTRDVSWEAELASRAVLDEFKKMAESNNLKIVFPEKGDPYYSFDADAINPIWSQRSNHVIKMLTSMTGLHVEWKGVGNPILLKKIKRGITGPPGIVGNSSLHCCAEGSNAGKTVNFELKTKASSPASPAKYREPEKKRTHVPYNPRKIGPHSRNAARYHNTHVARGRNVPPPRPVNQGYHSYQSPSDVVSLCQLLLDRLATS